MRRLRSFFFAGPRLAAPWPDVHARDDRRHQPPQRRLSETLHAADDGAEYPRCRQLVRVDRRQVAVPHDEVGERSEEHTSELKSLMRISYAVFCLKKKKKLTRNT